MSGLAALLLELGHKVTGSDNDTRNGSFKASGYNSSNIAPKMPVGRHHFSSAIKADNPVLTTAREIGKPTARRAEALAAIMAGKRGIVVAGMHGKTTTSSMIAHVLREGGLHPSHYVGAEIPILGTNAHWDPRGEYFVAEGDESDGTLRFFKPEHSLILNIEEEHLDFYADLAHDKVFSRLMRNGQLSFYSADDISAARLWLCDCGNTPVFRRAYRRRYRAAEFASVFCVCTEETAGRAVLNVPGQLAFITPLGGDRIATEGGIPFEGSQPLCEVCARPAAFESNMMNAFLVVDCVIPEIQRP
jgi:UDP-N-acetylmuramate-alanine ligase